MGTVVDILQALPGPVLILIIIISATIGNPGIFILGALSVDYLLSFWVIIIGGVLGNLLTEIPWFFAGNLGSRFQPPRFIRKSLMRHKKFTARIQHLFSRHVFFAFFLARVFYGTKVAVIMYAGGNRMPFWRFFGVLLPTTIIWIVLLAVAGFIAGKGITLFAGFLEQSLLILVAGVFALVAFYLCVKPLWYKFYHTR